MRIGLNLLHAVPEIGGGWNYMQSLLAMLGRVDLSNDYFAFVTTESAQLVPRQPNFHQIPVSIRPGSRPQRLLFEQTALPAMVWRRKLECLHWFANTDGIINAAPPVVTIYDLQPFLPTGSQSRAKRAFLRSRLRSTVRRGAMLLPMSETTAQLLTSTLQAAPARMVVIPPVLESDFAPATRDQAAAIRRQYELPDAFWLYVAHMYPHKNHDRLLRAYKLVRDRDSSTWPLVLRGDDRGSPMDLASRIAELGLTAFVRVLPRLEPGALAALYSAAAALIFPSTYEGAGIPVLEAQACGCAVVASDIPAVREFAGDAARYFDPHVTESIAEAMLAAAADAGWREAAGRLGIERASHFRGPASAQRLIAAYAHVIQRHRSGREASPDAPGALPSDDR